jgi:hypothetical protein
LCCLVTGHQDPVVAIPAGLCALDYAGDHSPVSKFAEPIEYSGRSCQRVIAVDADVQRGDAAQTNAYTDYGPAVGSQITRLGPIYCSALSASVPPLPIVFDDDSQLTQADVHLPGPHPPSGGDMSVIRIELDELAQLTSHGNLDLTT